MDMNYVAFFLLQGIKYAHVRANRNSKTNNEMNLAGVLIVIVIVFLLCHFPRLTIFKGDEIRCHITL